MGAPVLLGLLPLQGLLLTVAALCPLRGAGAKIIMSPSAQVNGAFKVFTERYNRSYSANTHEYFLRMINLQESMKRHQLLNAPSPDISCNMSARYGINQFSDLSPKEFREQYLTGEPAKVPQYPNRKAGGHTSEDMALPAKFDWRDKNVVTEVQNQESCGGCWAFSVVGAVESVYAKGGHPLEQLSVQQVIDCSYQNQGCKGGSTIRALNWLMKTQEKLVNESEYPFKAATGVCHLFPLTHFGVSVKDFAAFDFRQLDGSIAVDILCVSDSRRTAAVVCDVCHMLLLFPIRSGLEEVMMQKLVEWGPLVVTVDAMSWQDYLGGVIQHHCSSHQANHAVLIIGYDTTGEVPYWIVRNSWGTSWGNQGYVYIKMGENICGIADAVAAVFV
ncbi:Cathepsin O precursor-like [Scleropages formosus]|uniref:Cathepsin O-like n=1 Tax=Scleropages formosus TaxID=113540 RepID=A0A0P7UY22_SCLFO|nr:Cathepsin O precursor-like [Scleropages formosus]